MLALAVLVALLVDEVFPAAGATQIFLSSRVSHGTVRLAMVQPAFPSEWALPCPTIVEATPNVNEETAVRLCLLAEITTPAGLSGATNTF